MNNCVLLAEVLEPAKLRYTQDNQTPIAEVVVQFEGSRPDDRPSKLKVVGWNNMAETLQQTCHPGDRILVEGNLRMSMVERPGGFKEKVAELTARRIHSLGTTSVTAAGITPGTLPSNPAESFTPQPLPSFNPTPLAAPVPPANVTPPDYDDIPF